MVLLRGQTITLFDRVQTGTDGFNAPVYDEVPVSVDNVLVCPASTEAIVEGMDLWGKRAAYELLIPKGDAHQWEDREVSFFGTRWRTFGFVLQWPEGITPGAWDRKVKVERYV